MRDYGLELEKRVGFIKKVLKESGANGIIFANSGGKDCVLVGILCKKACDNTLGLMLPCGSKQNFTTDIDDGNAFTEQFNIENRTMDLTEVRDLFLEKLSAMTELNHQALINIAPRLRMTTLYALAAAEGRLVAGTGNRSEIHMGYFTKWGDGAYDFNPIADLTATEVLEFLRYLDAPQSIISKKPSAGLFEGQTDEDDMGVSYDAIDTFLKTGEVSEGDGQIIDRYHSVSHHKRRMPLRYGIDSEA